jgi:glycosyltransferase involved in cell wall biosynthesis
MTEPLSIGLVAPLPPQTGGVASFAQWLVDNEAEIGCRYDTFDLRRPPEAETGGRLRVDAALRQPRLVLRFLRWLRHAPRVVHYCVALTATGLPRDLLLVALLRATGRRTVAHVHGPAFDPEAPPPFKPSLLKLLGRLSSRRISVMPLAEWQFFPNPLRLEPEQPPHRDATTPVRLLAVGSFGELKGSDTLVDALAAARASGVDAILRFAGRELRRGEERDLRELVRRRGLDDAVEFCGVLAPDRLREEYEQAHVFCLPSRREGMPMALLEAMAFDLPVVATPVGAVPTFVEDDVTGVLIDPGDAGGLGQAIGRLAGDADLRRRLGSAGGARVRALCDPDTIAAQWGELYAKLAQ